MAASLPTGRELEALKRLWARGKVTVRELFGDQRPKEGDQVHRTVLSLLQTMEQKGHVGHEAAGRAYVYYPRVRQEQVLQGLAGGPSIRSSTARSANTSRGRSSRGGIAWKSPKPWNG